MSSLNSLYIKTDVLRTIVDTLEKKGDKGIELTVAINDETNQYGQNLSSYVSQSKEDREAQKPRFYVGNGKCFWTDGKITVAEKQDAAGAAPKANSSQQMPPSQDEEDDLPF